MDDAAIIRHWGEANRALIAKMISELTYEQVLAPHPLGGGYYVLDLPDVGPWQFHARDNLWGQPMVTPSSLQPPYGASPEAADWLMAVAPQLGMDDGQIAEHLQDLYATLRADCHLRARREGLTADDAVQRPAVEREALLTGHPKFLFKKGRRGWGITELQRYAPESGTAFRLHWVAVIRDALTTGGQPIDADSLLASALDTEARNELQRRLSERVADPRQYALMPVHPWQWQQWIAPLYPGAIAAGRLVSLGDAGDYFRAQQSLRTLTNATRPVGYDIKLALTVMNTSCYCGIPAHFLLAGPAASAWLAERATTDPELAAAGLAVLAEPAGAVLPHPQYARLPQAPYRYHELTGVIWREAMARKCGADEQPMLLAELMETDAQQRPWLAGFMKAASATSPPAAERWLTRLFEVTVVPLWHLMCRYGVSLIAHGQNITVILRDGWPARLALKDFQGDLRLVDEAFPEASDLPPAVTEACVRLPPEQLIQDLQTGHFVTTLRFIAPLAEAVGVSERRFYQLCRNVLTTYQQRHPALAQRFRRVDLFAPRIRRLRLNQPKFVHATDTAAARMLADASEDVANPLHHCDTALGVAMDNARNATGGL